ncbi:unnamed protein product [Didymodactylos carnosus]|uniref:Uncharacterized protein n=1 Tax=Didymodactylos carnosus TaxID=1234261 RepID=A0A814EJ58_9BILA|nr:unnamed protein product [Didymodactylos carnosus]CAF0971848.1 unnamed protein product [Didymodactylos carnosus]CAF3739046.1 unnamed protein product [Didymodactylos carnosus]CAF3744858.1 unnamed protein product [Didymodactylos carnosus]
MSNIFIIQSTFYNYQTCQEISHFFWLSTSGTYKTFFYDVQLTFSSCFNYNTKLKLNYYNKILCYCANTSKYISNYRVKDNFDDYLFSTDEKFDSSTNVCQLNLNNRFKCLTTSDCIERQTMLSNDENIR